MGTYIEHAQVEAIRTYSRMMVRELGFLNKFPRDEDISASQIHIMIELNRYGRLKGSELCDALQLDKSTISRSTKMLVEKGWITSSEDAKDARSKEYMLTSAGHKRLELSSERAHKIVNKAMAVLDDEQRTIVIEGLRLYAEALVKSREEQVQIIRYTPDIPVENIVHFINDIQTNEFGIMVSETVNHCLYDLEQFYKGFKGDINFWLAFEGDEIVGTIGLSDLGSNQGELRKLFVKREYRGTGLAQKLLSRALSQAKEENVSTIYLGTTDKFHAAHKFYEKSGFTEVPKGELPESFDICEVDSIFYEYQNR